MSKPAKSPRQPAANWLGKLGILDGDWIFASSKLKLERGMKARCLGEAGRIWCCLGLHTEAFQQERAVKKVGERMVGGKNVPMLAPLQLADIARETGVKKQNVPRGLRALQAWGLAAIGEDGAIYCWVIPRDVDVEEVKKTDPLAEVPEELRLYFKRFKILPAPGFRLEYEKEKQLQKLAKAYVDAAEELKRALRESTARDDSAEIARAEKPPPRDAAIQRTTKEQEKNSAGQSVSQSPVEPPEPPPGRLAAQGKSLRPIHTWMLEQLGEMLPGEPGPKVCAETESAIGDMPRDELMRLFRARDKNLAHYGWGLVPRLAEEARSKWERDAGNRAALDAKLDAVSRAQRRDAIETATRTLADPSADELTKQWAREILEEPNAEHGN